ncbi:MAG: VIT and VWA domain-containing protein [Planctomycetota bacterium]|nr:VIT and VWA domain-containing protein [Planctomycetota bacterium]
MKRHVCLSALCVGLLATVLVLRPHAVVLPPNCPVSLTNPDGQALNLEKYDLRVAVHGPLSLVEMEMVFRNPENRQMEGRFQYLLPPGATISRFAKEVNGKLMEGEVVERLRAQAIYTQILHTMRDPALLEMDQGNRFSARVFPIPANGTVRLLLAYSQVIPMQNGERKVVIPMAGMPAMPVFNTKVHLEPADGEELLSPANWARDKRKGSDVIEFSQWGDGLGAQTKDLEIIFKPKMDAPRTNALKAGNFQMLAFRPEIPQGAAEPKRDWVFYFDTSASNADTEARRIEAVNTLFEHAGKSGVPDYTLFAFDVGVALLGATYGKEIPPGWAGLLLRRRHFLGATNLEAAMKHIGEQARAAQKPTRFVLVSDGIATLGAREARDIQAALGEWPPQHVLHALVIGNKQDEKMLAAIVEKTRGRVVTLPLSDKIDSDVAKAMAELQAPLGASFEFYDEGAAWIYPKTFRDVRAGSELIVFSELKDGAPSKPGVIHRGVDGKVVKDTALTVTPGEVPAFAPLLQREAYHAFLDHLDKLEQAEKTDAKRAELHKQRIEVSVKNRVLCPLTSLLVLETEDDYRRFGIERTALADIMIVGKTGIELKKRGADDMPPPRARPPVAKARAAEKRKLEKAEAEAADRPAGPHPTGGRPAADEELNELKDAKGQRLRPRHGCERPRRRRREANVRSERLPARLAARLRSRTRPIGPRSTAQRSRRSSSTNCAPKSRPRRVTGFCATPTRTCLRSRSSGTACRAKPLRGCRSTRRTRRSMSSSATVRRG